MIRLALALCALAMSCTADNGPGPDDFALGKAFDVKVGQTAVIASERLYIVFQEVQNDSRCPKNAVCIWAGDAEVVLQAETAPENREELRVHSNGQFATSATFEGYSIELRGLAPPNTAGVPTDPKAYVATLLVTRLER